MLGELTRLVGVMRAKKVRAQKTSQDESAVTMVARAAGLTLRSTGALDALTLSAGARNASSFRIRGRTSQRNWPSGQHQTVDAGFTLRPAP